MTIFAIVSVLILIIFTLKPNYGLYCLAFLLPFIGVFFDINGLIIPLADLIALILLLSFFINYFFRKEKREIKWPLMWPFALFFIVNIISLAFIADLNYSFYNIIRWPVFLYFAYIWLPFNYISDRKVLKKTIIFLFLSTFLVLITGYLSLIGQNWQESFFRLTSFKIFNIYPFYDNHNLIAEFLNVGVFLTLIIKDFVKSIKLKKVFNLVFILFIVGIILSFSRAGWITLALQLLIYFSFQLRYFKKTAMSWLLYFFIFILALSPFYFKMQNLQVYNYSSTQSRVLLNDIAIKAFLEKPIFGHGSGQFMNLVAKDVRFTAQHGDPIDAHGFVQKIISENGLLGLLAWLYILIIIAFKIYRSLKKYYPQISWILPLSLSVFGSLFFQIFNTSYYKGKVWLPIVLLLISIEFLDKAYDKKTKSTSRST